VNAITSVESTPWPFALFATASLSLGGTLALQIANPGQAAALDNGLAKTPPMGFNDGSPQTLTFAVSTDFNTLGVMNVTLHLAAGSNTVTLANPSASAPDFDRIIVARQLN
jgi:hypothetical protein